MESAAAWGDSGLPVRPLFQVHAPYAQTTQGNDLAGSLLTAPSFLRGPHAVRCGCLCAHAGNGEKNGGECARDQHAIVHHILTGTCSSDDRREYSRFPTFLQDRSQVQTAAVREMLENGTHATLRNRRREDQRRIRQPGVAFDTHLRRSWMGAAAADGAGGLIKPLLPWREQRNEMLDPN